MLDSDPQEWVTDGKGLILDRHKPPVGGRAVQVQLSVSNIQRPASSPDDQGCVGFDCQGACDDPKAIRTLGKQKGCALAQRRYN